MHILLAHFLKSIKAKDRKRRLPARFRGIREFCNDVNEAVTCNSPWWLGIAIVTQFVPAVVAPDWPILHMADIKAVPGNALLFSISAVNCYLGVLQPQLLGTEASVAVIMNVLNLAQVEDSLVFQTGQDVMANNGVVLFGMSPGNPYFKSRVIEDYVDYLGKENRRIIVVVPQQPAEHTYRALGSKDAVKRAKKNSSQLKSHCRRAIEKVK